MIELNQVYLHEFQFTQDEVNRFAAVTGDNNPVHTDAAFAATTPFKRPIMHGMLGASVFSRVFGTLFPGEGTIYLKQSLVFLKPMFTDTAYEACFTVKELIKEKNRVVIETVIREKGNDKVHTTGEATVMVVAGKIS
ncbi:MAG TPA: MaoC family dehydratase [Bacteroidia bacterium]|jgi:acyl dehydratase|nr:MaoC family dehydratase [Bacteroidia bacterium]